VGGWGQYEDEYNAHWTEVVIPRMVLPLLLAKHCSDEAAALEVFHTFVLLLQRVVCSRVEWRGSLLADAECVRVGACS
jgi:hypothetical protein